MSVESRSERFVRSALILTAAFSLNACKAPPEKNPSNNKVTPIPELSPTPFRPETTSIVSSTPTEHIATPPIEIKEKYLTPENIVFPTAIITIPPTPTFTPTSLPTPTPEIVISEIISEIILSPWEEKTYQAIQELRRQENLPLLELSEGLIEVAHERSLDMATRNYFSHTTPEGLMVYDLMAQRGLYPYGGELLARTNIDRVEEASQEIIENFLGSPAHRQILLAPYYNLIGVGYALSEEDNIKYITIVLSFPVK